MTATQFDWNWQLRSGPEDLWPWLSDTNRLYEALSLPPIRVTDRGSPDRPGRFRLAHEGVRNYEVWEEELYEWEYPFRYALQRNYLNGPFRGMRQQVDLVPHEQGTLVRIRTRLEPRNRLLSFLADLKYATLVKRRYRAALRSFDQHLQSSRLPYQAARKKALVKGGERRLAEAQDTLISMTGNARVTEYLVNFIRRAGMQELHRIRPYRLAGHWGIDKREVLRVFLAGAHAGLLNLNWDVLCPKCNSVQDSCDSLADVHEPLFCRHCREKFSVHFSHSLRLNFRSNPLIRKSDASRYCITGPHSQPHITVRQLLEPGESRYLKTRLFPGDYEIRSAGLPGEASLNVAEEGKDTVRVRLTPHGFRGEEVALSPEPNLILENSTPFRQAITIESLEWESPEVCACEATSLQIFRELFKHEVIRKGERMAAEELTFMFTDLRDSTGIYRNEGDHRAVGRLIEHFEILQKTVDRAGGAIVKTIGDSVMAVFNRPVSALKAFLEAQRLTAAGSNGKPFRMKAGIHRGDCVAVNMNDQIDYFGNTVNLASRLVDYAGENEAVISRDVSDDPLVQRLLEVRAPFFHVREDTPKLKGYEEETHSILRISPRKETGRHGTASRPESPPPAVPLPLRLGLTRYFPTGSETRRP